ncbi:MAG: hypothetical protein VBE63_04260 [Lamprobacter sp.]|uniref:hypothetical protein n=1 Tax=Lamprobacter sp. TaxID=3100796 RepID=UPI002B25E172|nr:hypothetical protein [Lamprobacter sp.]MEA3639139.1 hypothetical protein [Lamprobacter sp.]
MRMRPVTAFLLALASVVMLLAGVAVIHSRFDASTGAGILLDGDWELHHLVQWGPYKGWRFQYQLTLSEQDGRLYGEGVTLAVNDHSPGPREQTSLQVVDGVREHGQIIAWIFERNGDRAGRGAIKWRVVDEHRLVGAFATTFYRGASVAQRIKVPSGSGKRVGHGQAATCGGC